MKKSLASRVQEYASAPRPKQRQVHIEVDQPLFDIVKAELDKRDLTMRQLVVTAFQEFLETLEPRRKE